MATVVQDQVQEKIKHDKKLSNRAERRLKWWKEHCSKGSEEIEGKDTENKDGEQKRKLSVAQKVSRKRKVENSEGDIEPGEYSLQTVSKKDIPCTSPLKQIPKTAVRQKEKHYVLFVGNLPFTITKDEVFQYFYKEAGGVKAVRLLTDRQTGKPKGFAYVEFEHARSYKQALRLHHSDLGGRKINVEFTSIGGKNEQRIQKLKKVNKTLANFKLPASIKSSRKTQKSAHWKIRGAGSRPSKKRHQRK